MKKSTLLVFILVSSLCFSRALGQSTETIAGWLYWYGGLFADQGSIANENTSVLSLIGNTESISISDADGTGQRAFALGWANGANTKAWKMQLISTKFKTLKFSCKMAGTSPFTNYQGPRDFKLQYSTDNTNWVDVTGGTLQAGNGTSAFTSLSNVVLPAACENKPALYLRMLMTSNTAVNGGTVSGGQSHIDDIMITAVSIPEAPTDISLSNNFLNIQSPGGSVSTATTIGSLSSTDFNLGNTFTYSLVPGTGSTSNSLFSVSGNILSNASGLAKGTYSIRIRSTDNSGFSVEKILSIKVTERDPVSQGTRQRISFMGSSGIASLSPTPPVNSCYNSTNNEYLSVWSGDDNIAPLVDDELEIFAQRINANTGVNSGSMIRISFMGTNGQPYEHQAINPSVTYNSTNNEYMVVWQGTHNTGTLNVNENEIWGRRVDASNGNLLGSMVRISTMGTDGNANINAETPDVSWNSINNQYLVVWCADDNTAPVVDDEYEVYGQRISNIGALSGTRLRISTMGPNGNSSYGTYAPALSYNATNNQFMVVWTGDHNTAPLVNFEYEVFGQAITNTGTLSGAMRRISSMGPNGNTTYGVTAPDISWNSTSNKYFVVWSADDNSGLLINDENEIYGQFVDNLSALSGSRIRLSDMGADGNSNFNALNPKLCYNVFVNEFWVVWESDDDVSSADDESEIFMQRVNSQGTEVGTNDSRISYMGASSDASVGASYPSIAYNSTNNKAFVTWYSNDNTSPLVAGEFEVFGQSLYSDAILPVTWMSFTADLLNNQTVGLTWKTAAETNSKEFIVQRGISSGSWYDIGNQAASGNSNTVRQYQFIDPKPNQGNNYYRIMQKDIDGASSYSKVVLVSFDKLEFGIFPNPVTDYLTLQLPGSGIAFIQVFDNTGRIVHQQQYHSADVVLDVKDVPAGIYHLQILRNEVMHMRKFVKK